jgi:hypothetical protein
MPTKTQGALHPNPRIAKALAENARNGHKYKSAADLCRAVNITDMPTQRAVRQIMRDAGQGVGRGRRYDGITTPTVVKAAKATRQGSQSAGKKATGKKTETKATTPRKRATPKAKTPSVKAEPVATPTPSVESTPEPVTT